MPVFARIATADPVEATSITAVALDTSTDIILDTTTCTCLSSESHKVFDGVVESDFYDTCATSNDFKGHLSSCPLHTDAIPTFAQMKQLARIKRQLFLEQQSDKKVIQPRDPFECIRRIPTRTCHLFPGSKFEGKQNSGSHSYDVVVDIKDVNLDDSTLCGYLHIKGLTEQYPELTTFFDAEIIGPEHSFFTQKWDADKATDEEHWSHFKPFHAVLETSKLEDINYDFRSNSFIFMRWKEHFLVPDHRIEGIAGASFAGFYYICYNKRTGQINGLYYHSSSDRCYLRWMWFT
ncbi:GID complex subunit 4, VID24 [Entomortierella beljakovae]|nr:GID complex subunit 4, VID24 [Entomortierella beljakovae]